MSSSSVEEQVLSLLNSQDSPASIAQSLRPLTSDKANAILSFIRSSQSSLSQDAVVSILKEIPSSELEDLGMSIRSAWNGELKDNTVDEWTQLNAFVARINQAQISNFDLYAIWAFRPSLEASPYSTDRVPAAKAWILYSGARLWQLSRDKTGLGRAARGGERWKGFEGYNKERWQLWKDAFKELGEEEVVKRMTDFESA